MTAGEVLLSRVIVMLIDKLDGQVEYTDEELIAAHKKMDANNAAHHAYFWQVQEFPSGEKEKRMTLRSSPL